MTLLEDLLYNPEPLKSFSQHENILRVLKGFADINIANIDFKHNVFLSDFMTFLKEFLDFLKNSSIIPVYENFVNSLFAIWAESAGKSIAAFLVERKWLEEDGLSN